jgi:polysaccharide pyruvyl transferase
MPAFEYPLRDCLARHRGFHFVFVEPGGNWGDELISRGAEALANRVGLKWRRTTCEEFLKSGPRPDEAIYLHGGGGYNPWCSGRALIALEHAIRHCRGPIVQGPQTFDDAEGYFDRQLLPILAADPSRHLILYVRELTSLAALAARVPAHVSLRLDHDTALHLTPAELPCGRSEAGRYDLLALREDNEAPSGVPEAAASGVRLDPARYALTFEHWVRIHARSRTITTNRTHSAVIGAVLGKPTTMLAGSYHKNRSIWEYSLKPRGVSWRDWDHADAVPLRNEDPGRFASAYGRIARSWKVQRGLRWLHGVPWS